jgi:cell division protein FtsI (penicillin-binding protein 3)
MEVGAKRQKRFLKDLGILRPVSIELPERGMPSFPQNWQGLSMMTISYGHGISVTPLHLVQGVTSLMNEGKKTDLTLLHQRDAGRRKEKAERVVSRETSHKMRRLLRSVVQYGTGKQGDAAGYRVGGKTGTAEKISGRGYSKQAQIASFLGMFPADDPEYVVLVMLDEPQGNKSTYGYATGGWVAAPVASRVISQMAPMLGIQPVMDVQPDALDAQWEHILQAEEARRRGIHAASY